MNFSDYAADKDKQNRCKDKQSAGDFKPDRNTERILREFLKKYDGKTQSQLMEEILSIATKKRRQGALSDAELDGFYAMLKPLLKPEQLSELDMLMEKLKSIC